MRRLQTSTSSMGRTTGRVVHPNGGFRTFVVHAAIAVAVVLVEVLLLCATDSTLAFVVVPSSSSPHRVSSRHSPYPTALHLRLKQQQQQHHHQQQQQQQPRTLLKHLSKLSLEEERNDESRRSNKPTSTPSLTTAAAVGHVEDSSSSSLSSATLFRSVVRRCAVATSAALVSLLLLVPTLWVSESSLSSSSTTASAASYASLTDEQKVVAEAWRLVDNSFLDRTFNHQDWFAMRQSYVNTKYQTMDDAHDAIAKLVASLGDPYTRYLTPSQYQSLVDAATGTLAGIGIEISFESSSPSSPSSSLRIVASDVQDDSPAVTAGIRPGDFFRQVDGVDITTEMKPDDVANLLRGPVNSKVGVVMERKGQVMDYKLQRKPIIITAVQSYMANSNAISGKNEKVGVVRIKNFSGTTAATVSAALSQLRQNGATALVLDVRGNPGGLLPGGVDTAALFLPAETPVVYVVNKVGIVDAQRTYTDGIDTTTPLVVLVDQKTASAAEVMSAALQENNRAVLVGEQTFGKGIVQTIRELSSSSSGSSTNGKNGGIAITVARYETPQHHDINRQGIAVNVKSTVDCAKNDATACLQGTDLSSAVKAAAAAAATPLG